MPHPIQDLTGRPMTAPGGQALPDLFSVPLTGATGRRGDSLAADDPPSPYGRDRSGHDHRASGIGGGQFVGGGSTPAADRDEEAELDAQVRQAHVRKAEEFDALAGRLWAALAEMHPSDPNAATARALLTQITGHADERRRLSTAKIPYTRTPE